MEHKKPAKQNPFEKFYKKSPRGERTFDEGPKSERKGRSRPTSNRRFDEEAEAPRSSSRTQPQATGRVQPRASYAEGGAKAGHTGNRGAGNLRINFVYEDQDIIAVEKPAGLPVIAAENSRARNALDLVTKHLQIKNPKGRAAVVHRLDRDTSGIMIFAKNAKTKTILMKNWDKLVTRRCYTALVEGRLPQQEGVVTSWLREQSASRVREVPKGTHGALRAVTHYRVLGVKGPHSLVELELETGRRHQIRVQLAGLGNPVAGDSTYGATTDPAGLLCLHASLLVLTHPHTGRELVLESALPEWALTGRRSAPRT